MIDEADDELDLNKILWNFVSPDGKVRELELEDESVEKPLIHADMDEAEVDAVILAILTKLSYENGGLAMVLEKKDDEIN